MKGADGGREGKGEDVGVCLRAFYCFSYRV